MTRAMKGAKRRRKARPLPAAARASTVDTQMPGNHLADSHKLAISAGQAERRQAEGKPVDALTVAAQAEGYSLRGLAKEAEKRLQRKVHVSVLTNARAGRRPCPEDVAAVVALLVPRWRATARNWPGGFSPPPAPRGPAADAA